MSWNAAKRVLSYGYPNVAGIRWAPMVGSAPTCRWWNRNRAAPDEETRLCASITARALFHLLLDHPPSAKSRWSIAWAPRRRI